MSGDAPIRPDAGASKAVLWRRLDALGLEYCELSPFPRRGWRLAGDVVTNADGMPLHLHYVVGCNLYWQTLTVRIHLDALGDPRHLTLNRSWRYSWRYSWTLDGVQQPALDDCVDIDLGFTPSTNTLPIRRLGLAVGESRELTAAWVRFPDFELLPLRQRYTRTGERTYRYESLESGFTADLTVDEAGLVISYPGLWERVAEAECAASTQRS